MSAEAAPVEYTLTPGVPNSHLIEIQVAYTPAPSKSGAGNVDFAIPAWRPGRYTLQNYARNIQEFSALDERRQKLPWEKIDKNTWRVSGAKSGQIRISYKVYANMLDAGSTLSNEDELYWNGTNVFMYVVGRKELPARLTVNTPAGWKLGSGLRKAAEPNVFSAPDYDTLADAPGIAGPTLDITSFDYDGTRYYLAFQGPMDYSRQKLAETLTKLVAEAIKIFGKAPFEEYWFLYHSVPNGFYHGVEHLNSTSITFPSSTFSTPTGLHHFYSTSAHEFFHAWNVKRIRPQALGPFDYSKEVYTRNLWVAEGVTSYYDELLCKRAGESDLKTFLGELTTTITTQQNTPGRKLTPVAEASFNEWLSPDDWRNVRLDFYNKGSLLGLLLDLEIRRRTANQKSLDDVMRYLNETYARNGIAYPEDGMQKALEAVAGGSFAPFFASYVNGVEELPYNDYLKVAGLELAEIKSPEKAECSLGVTLGGDERQTVLANVIPGEAAFQAGLDKGDVLLALNREQATIATLNGLLRKYKPGDTVTVHVMRSGRLREFSVTLQGGGNISYEVRPLKTATAAERQVLASWLNEP